MKQSATERSGVGLSNQSNAERVFDLYAVKFCGFNFQY